MTIKGKGLAFAATTLGVIAALVFGGLGYGVYRSPDLVASNFQVTIPLLVSAAKIGKWIMVGSGAMAVLIIVTYRKAVAGSALWASIGIVLSVLGIVLWLVTIVGMIAPILGLIGYIKVGKSVNA